MRRLSPLLLALLAAACGRQGSERAPAAQAADEVPEGRIRARSVTLDDDWKAVWLDSEGWEFFGQEFEAGTAGTVEVSWSDARSGRPFASFSFEAFAGKSVRAIYGLRARPALEAETLVECPGCGSRRRLRGTWVPDEITCKKCDTKVPVHLEWQSRPTRDLQVLLRGDCRHVKAGGGLKLRGTTFNSGSGNSSYLFGEIPAHEVAGGIGTYCDPLEIRRHGAGLFGAGEHDLSLRIQLPTEGRSSMATRRENDSLEFSRIAGPVEVTGTEKTYAILVDGTETSVPDYPYPIWKFTLRYRPQP